MADEFYIGQIFQDEYPPEAANWCNTHERTYMGELERVDSHRMFQIMQLPAPTPEEVRQQLDALTLTPADVERALYKEKGMDFDDLKALIIQALPTVDVKALSIEFRAKDFYRGATFNGIRLFDAVGQLLGYTSDDMDYLFLHKELPSAEEEE